MTLPPHARRSLSLLGILVLAAALAYAVDAARSAARPEVVFFREHQTPSFEELSRFFGELARERGALYAYGVLRAAALPPNIDLHLLGHVVGDELYAQRGVAAVADCTPEFRNACSHSVVIGVFTDDGEAGLSTIATACRKAPGGIGAYGMCFHGLGHGIFAHADYHLPQAIAACRKTETAVLGGREYIECVGGIIMELVGGEGGHDKTAFARAQERYLSAKDPLSPCDTALIPDEVKPICYLYVTPRLFTHDGGDLGHPGEREFRQAFGFCEHISAGERENRRACFEGVGKELPTLLAQRDIRAIDKIPAERMGVLHSWCALALSEDGREHCTRSIVQSLFWGGENDPRAAVAFCARGEGEARDTCFSELFIANGYYHRLATATREGLCALVPPEHRADCSAAGKGEQRQ